MSEIDVTIFVPCYNESKNIVSALDVINESMQLLNLRFEIIIIDDGSTDDSYNIVKKYIENSASNNIKVYRQPKNIGLAYNFVEAAILGSGKYFRQVNGDADESVENMLKLFYYLGKYDIIIPYHEDASARAITRRIISKIYTFIINFINGYKIKYYNGLPIFKRVDILRWHSYSQGFGYQAEFLSCLLSKGRTYIEVALVAKPRKSGKSKAFSFANIMSVCFTLVKLCASRFFSRNSKQVCLTQ